MEAAQVYIIRYCLCVGCTGDYAVVRHGIGHYADVHYGIGHYAAVSCCMGDCGVMRYCIGARHADSGCLRPVEGARSLLAWVDM